MRVLHIFDGRRIEPHLQIDYILGLQKYCDVFIYGPSEHEINGSVLSPIKYDADLMYTKIVDLLKPDMILLPEYAILKMLPNYKSIGDVVNTKKVSIEVDSYSYDAINAQLIELGIDFIISRGPYQKGYFAAPYTWMPWSVPDEICVDQVNYHNRFNKIVFVGGGRDSQNRFYDTRRMAIRLLEVSNMLDYFSQLDYKKYLDVITKYKCGLSCSLSSLQMAPAKVWEYMARGCLVLCPWFHGSESIFKDEKCYVQYESDCSNLFDVVNYVVDNEAICEQIAINGWKTVCDKHTHTKRVKEMYDVLESVLNGNEVVDKWSVD